MMTACPTEAELHQLIEDALPMESTQEIDRHLSTCQLCQHRLETLANVNEYSSMQMPATMESVNLKRAIVELQSELTTYTVPQRLTTIPDLPPSDRPDRIGRLGDIEIVRVIGRGGMGVVFEGYDTVLSRSVAVKLLSPHLLHDKEARGRFLREAQAAAALTHENVVAIHGINVAEAQPYLVLQYVSGESLASRLTREKYLSCDEVVRIGVQIALGLDSAHAQGLVHRDIKPANILLDTQGNVRITDFGLAKCVGTETLTEVGAIAGTPAYMSPEQAAGGDIDSRSDLFSLGVLLYQLSSGKLPFEADSPYVLLDLIRRVEPASLQELNPELPGWFCETVHRLLDKRPEERIASAGQLAEMLSVAQAPKRKRKPSKWGKRLALGLAGLIIAAAVYLFVKERPQGADVTADPNRNGFSAAPGFRILDTNDQYNTLAEAVQHASDKAVILVQGDGPFETSSIRIENKEITIRALPGSTPRFVSDSRSKGERNSAHFLQSNSDLRIEGIEVDWPAIFAANQEDNSLRGVIQNTRGRLTVHYCKISCGALNACVGSSGRDLQINNCHLIAKGAQCMNWRPNSAPARIENCLLEGAITLSMNPNLGKEPVIRGITLANNLILTERTINLVLLNNPQRAVPIHAQSNVINSHIVFAMMGMKGFTRNLDTHNEIVGVLTRGIRWTERGNIYSSGTVYAAGSKPNQPLTPIPSDLRQLADWNTTWNLKDTTSITATIRVTDTPNTAGDIKSASFETLTGALPEYVGIQQRIGPGTPLPHKAMM